METATHTRGSFCTSVLRTRDIKRAKTFYGALFGWTAQEIPDAPAHRLLQLDGKTVASLHEIAEGEDIWVPHVSVEDPERTTAEALKLGATLVDTTDVRGLARLATLRDAENTTFGLWQPAPYEGAQLTEVVGSLWWIEVLANNVAGARNFYGRLFDWTPSETSFEPFASYVFFKREDVNETGILPIDPDWEISPRWNTIFAVNDCNATIKQAEALGGCEIFTHTVPKAGRIGLLTDPGGALFLIRGPVPDAAV